MAGLGGAAKRAGSAVKRKKDSRQDKYWLDIQAKAQRERDAARAQAKRDGTRDPYSDNTMPRRPLTAAEMSKYLGPQNNTGERQARGAEALNKADYGLDRDVTSDMYMEDPLLLGPSKRATVQADPAAIAAQQRAMDELFGIYSQGGATAQDRAREAQARANSDQYLRSQREAHQQDLAERGMGGSGAEIGMLLGDRQNAGQQMSQSDLETQAMHEQRAMDALMRGGDLAGKMRGSSFEEAGYRGEAEDELAAMNNLIVNKAGAANTDWLREQKDKVAREQFDAWQRKMDRGVGVAEGLTDSDRRETESGFDLAGKLGGSDADAYNRANENVGRAVANQPTAGDRFGVASGTTAATHAGRNEALGGLRSAYEGVGQVGDAAVGAGAGSSSGSALDFGAPQAPDDEDEED
jgi:hypothetical protein